MGTYIARLFESHDRSEMDRLSLNTGWARRLDILDALKYLHINKDYSKYALGLDSYTDF